VYPFKSNIQVVQDGNAYLVTDGFLRIMAFKNPATGAYDNPATRIPATVAPAIAGKTPIETAKYYASITNLTHGHTHTRQDKINAVMMYLQLPGNKSKSNKEIAKELRVNRRYHVAEARRLLKAGYTKYDKPLPVTTQNNAALISGMLHVIQNNADVLFTAAFNQTTNAFQVIRNALTSLHDAAIISDITYTTLLLENNRSECDWGMCQWQQQKAYAQLVKSVSEKLKTVLETNNEENRQRANNVPSPIKFAHIPPTPITFSVNTPAPVAPESAERGLQRIKEVVQYVATARSALQIVPMPTKDTVQEYLTDQQALLAEIQGLLHDYNTTFLNRLNAAIQQINETA